MHCRAPRAKYSLPQGTELRGGRTRTIEQRVYARIEAVFPRCPELFRFSVRHRSGLPDHIDPTTLAGELFIFDIALAPPLGQVQYDEAHDAIAPASTAAVPSGPLAKDFQ